MNFSDIPVMMACGDEPMVGIISRPQRPSSLGLVIVVGGPQYRVGSHRQFLLLAHCLASAGYAVLRFDYRGMGDSGGDIRCFDSVDEDISMAVDTLLQQCPEVDRVALWGLCDGAAASLLYWGQRSDPRITGLCLLNPWVRSEITLARTRVKHYYGERLMQRAFWRKLLQGQLEWRRSWAALWQNIVTARQVRQVEREQQPFQQKMALALRRFPGRVLLILSGRDDTAKEFVECATSDPDWTGLLCRTGLQRVDVPEADHTFSKAQWRALVEQAVLDWMAMLSAPEHNVS
ncbi:MAG: hydrolase 1, exosortase A system-associated [Pseudomonadota bacterium]